MNGYGEKAWMDQRGLFEDGSRQTKKDRCICFPPHTHLYTNLPNKKQVLQKLGSGALASAASNIAAGSVDGSSGGQQVCSLPYVYMTVVCVFVGRVGK